MSKLVRCLTALLLLSLAATTGFLPTLSAQRSSDFQLENGLRVSLRRTINAKTCAMVVLYDIGNLNDPSGKSGMAHFAEHVYCTGATESKTARSAEEFFRAYPKGANAQTGDRYTVFGAMFSTDRLVAELEDAAQRMTGIKVTGEDLQREIPRLDVELRNMFGGIPQLGVQNLNKQLRLPLPHDGQRGGDIKELMKVSQVELQKWLDQYYRPNNARLIVVGPFEIESTKIQIKKLFGDIEAGETPPQNKVPAIDQPSKAQRQTVEYKTASTESKTHLAITFAAPQADDERYPAYLVLATRLQLAVLQPGNDHSRMPINISLLDGPEFVSISGVVESDETADQTETRLRNYLNEKISKQLSSKEANQVINTYGGILNLNENPESMFIYNVYGWAFMIGRTAQLGIESTKLEDNIRLVNEKQLVNARRLFEKSKSAVTLLQPEKPDE